MQLTQKTRRQLQLQNIVYYILLLAIAGLLGWLTTRYNVEADWSANNRNKLNSSSIEIIKQLAGPVNITVFIGDDKITRNAVRTQIERYQRHNDKLWLTFVNPDTNPAQTRAMGVTRIGEVIVEYQGKQERLQQLTEEQLSNAFQRLLRNKERWIVFLTGHNERDPFGQENHGYSEFGRELSSSGFRVQTHNLLTADMAIPDNTQVLVIAGPSGDYLPAEVEVIKEYVKNGGNLLWLAEPTGLFGLESLAEQLGLRFLPGVIINPTSQLYGISQPDFVLIAEYPENPITESFGQFTLFPQAAGLESADKNPLLLYSDPFLQAPAHSWTETGFIENPDQIRFNENSDDRMGPITLGTGLTRLTDIKTENGSPQQQRIIVTGDGDFLANAFLGNGGNLGLGMAIINWLSHDDDFIEIKPISAPDTQLQLSSAAIVIIATGFLVVLPLGLLLSGVTIWFRRRKR